MSVATPPFAPPVPASNSPQPSWEIAKLFPYQGQWSQGDYLSLNTNHLVELSDGKIEVLDVATELHQTIVIFLFQALTLFVKAANLGKVLVSPRPVRLWEGKFREPDVLFMKAEHDARRRDDYWEGADLVMEVVSDHDRNRDLETKRIEYARAGIPEYWIVDPMLKEITVLKLAGDRYEPFGVHRPGQDAASALLSGFAVNVTAVFDAK
jgi:Uma2 family endonuclease